MGQVFYRDWTPGPTDVTYNAYGSQMQIESWTENIPRNLPLQTRTFYDNRRSAPDFYLANIQRAGYTLDELYPYPRGSTESWTAPPQPIRADVFNQIASRVRNVPFNGQAPTSGIYTGTQDLSMLT